MKPAKGSLLLHPAFIISLAALLLNDFYWKYAYGNWLTGKLSDVAGLLVFAVFLIEIFKKVSKTFIIVFTALVFAWWKSPLSQPVIDFFSSFVIQLHRTVDYTDLFAILVLPFVFFINPVTYKRYPSFQYRLKHVIGVVAFFALCADSPYRMLPYSQQQPNEISYRQEFCWKGSIDEILQHLKNKGLSVSEESERYYPLYPSYQALYYRVKNSDSSDTWQMIPQSQDSQVYIKQKLYHANYLVPEYKADGHVFKNIRFGLTKDDDDKKIVCVNMISFESYEEAIEANPDKKTRKKLKPYFENLFGIQPK